MRDIHWLREAEDEFADIINYVMQQFGQGVAMRVYDDIISRIDLLVEFPDLGTSEPRYHFNGLPLRVLHSKLTRVFYCVQMTEIIVVLLWNNRMDDRRLAEIIESRNE